ncbi:hypothetical protein ACLUXV_00220 [Limosilactobacillus reuteri subsp. suis]|uniref:Uncharacterized protein n=1 Tax=Limosilactobacillus reuteri TaxID=1598 RepID=A0ABD6XAY2_LIMRT|nr:hypothetical protein [Limosilactobacillus reuteri]PTM27686.1 hypothetical protein DA797_03295 [Limosilactobacillus reuteri]PTM30261.1 hypothetical protein DA796_02180 [Limosilactobacillus reuteri]
MGYNLNIDIDNEGALRLAIQGQQIPPWVYENSQTAHENKRTRLTAIHLQAIEEAQQNQQRKRRTPLQKQEQEDKDSQLNKSKDKVQHRHAKKQEGEFTL